MGRSLSLLLLLFSVGCVAQQPTEGWVTRQGGTLEDGRVRAQKLTADLLRSQPQLHCKIFILNRSDLTAFSWRDGRIFVSRGLMDVGDAAVSAAIAHEIAHIMEARQAVSGLRSDHSVVEIETRADQRGVALLQSCGLPPASMQRMLSEVLRQKALSPQVRRDLEQRIERLAHSH
jgi:predicted Zn-dependent protease